MLNDTSPVALACRIRAKASNLKITGMKLLPTFLQTLPETYEKALSLTTLTSSSPNTVYMSRRQERSQDNFQKSGVKALGQRTLWTFPPFPMGRGGRCFPESESREGSSNRINCRCRKCLQEGDAGSHSTLAEGLGLPLVHLDTSCPSSPAPRARTAQSVFLLHC